MMLRSSEEGLLAADLNKPLNLFLGAGFSTLAESEKRGPLPLGRDLKNEIVTEFSTQALSSLDLSSLYAFISADRKGKLRTFLEDRFKVSSFNPIYDNLRKLDVEFVYTTNIDDLCFEIFNARSSDSSKVLHDNFLYGAPRNPKEVIQYIALHGCVRHEKSELIFSPGQISSAFAKDQQTWYVFQHELQSRPTFFVGYGMQDAGVLQSLHGASTNNSPNKWIILHGDREEEAELYRSLGFHVAHGATQDFLETVGSLRGASTVTKRTNLTGNISGPGQIARRPIRNFFLGAEPEWSDAYSSQVVRRRIISSIKDSILKGRHVAIVGLPLSGKTTILKQTAADLSQDYTCLFFDKISPVQADVIIAENKDADPPIIFVDNMIDSRDSINSISKQVNAIFVCSEQSIYFDSFSLKSLANRLDVHSCSEVSTSDIQAIIDSIPAEVRRWNTEALSDVEHDIEDRGLFESLRRHVFDEALTDRFKQKLFEFEIKDREAFDVYLLSCYIAACRTLLSYDMINMFVDKKDKHYGYAYEVVARISEFLESIDLPEDQSQDHFSVRSRGLAAIALRISQPKSFGRVFERFHSAVSPHVIVDYSTFRRYAYDNDYAKKAYPNIKDGRNFYKRLVRVSDNPYDYQHGAIYLSKMKDFQDAFDWIDTAMTKSRGKAFTIRNTHARILFEANIDVLRKNPDDKTAYSGIAESMEVLKSCIVDDQRRTYHLLRYSDQALQIFSILESAEAVAWLKHAKDRLEDIIEKASQNGNRESYNLRKYRKLLIEVDGTLR